MADLDEIKKQKEIDKLTIDIANAQRNLRLEGLKAWAALLTPAIAAVTILGTVYIGYLQIAAKSVSDEDSNWRDTISLIDKIPVGDPRVRHVGTLLKPFLESARYRTIAIGVTLDQLPRLRDIDTFTELLNEAFPSPGPRDLQRLLDLGRRLQGEMARLSDPTGLALPDKADEKRTLISESGALCEPIALILRTADHRDLLNNYILSPSKSKSLIPLTDIYFERCDFSNIDFSDVDLTASTFDYIILDGAVISDSAPHSTYLWDATIWWTAKAIGPNLLSYLISNFKPYQFQNDFLSNDGKVISEYRDRVEIKRETWEREVRRLCISAGLLCTDGQISTKFP